MYGSGGTHIARLDGAASISYVASLYLIGMLKNC